jgi:hypothetical protein
MASAAVLDIPSSLSRPISPFRELGAYEALWAGAKTSFRTIAELFEKRPGAAPSDFVPETDAYTYAEKAKEILTRAGVERFGVRVHGAGTIPSDCETPNPRRASLLSGLVGSRRISERSSCRYSWAFGRREGESAKTFCCSAPKFPPLQHRANR